MSISNSTFIKSIKLYFRDIGDGYCYWFLHTSVISINWFLFQEDVWKIFCYQKIRRWKYCLSCFHPKTCHSYPAVMKLGTVMPYIKKVQNTYESRDTPLRVSVILAFFHSKLENVDVSRNKDIDCILAYKFFFIQLLWSLKIN